MGSLDDIVNVNITLNTTSVPRANFGIPICIAPLVTFTERVRIYTSYDSAVEDGLPVRVLKMLSGVFGQTPRPSQVWVGRRDAGTITVSIPNDVIVGRTYSILIGGTSFDVIGIANESKSDVVDALIVLINASGSAAIGKYTAAASTDGDSVVLTAIDPSASVSVSANSNMLVTDITASSTIGGDLTAINSENDGWYGFCIQERDKATILAAAEWAEPQTKIFFASSDDADVIDVTKTDDVLSTLQATRYMRTAFIADKHADSQYLEAAWMGRCFTIAPGGETWALKQLSGVQSSNYSATNKQVIMSKGGNTFEQYAPQIYLTSPGKVVSGEWIDVIRFRDWLQNFIQTSMVTMMINRDKVPYTDPGIALVVNNLQGSLRQGQAVGGISPDELDENNNTVPGFVITYPLSVNVPFQDKADRILNISFSARLAGAIHLVNITGSLSYELQ